MAAVVLHPRWKFQYFEDKWTSPGEAVHIKSGKAKVRKLWEEYYKKEVVLPREQSPEVEKPLSFIEGILNQVAPSKSQTRHSARKDQLHLYLEEPIVQHVGLMDYWRAREHEWPQLAAMAFDFLAVPAMSSECERIFSSCAKQTTPESSRLSGKMLWHQECLKNWQRRGAIVMARAWNGIPLDLD
jgi:hAT family C-terminal dimerisation region